jgi:hypothetical protein
MQTEVLIPYCPENKLPSFSEVDVVQMGEVAYFQTHAMRLEYKPPSSRWLAKYHLFFAYITLVWPSNGVYSFLGSKKGRYAHLADSTILPH